MDLAAARPVPDAASTKYCLVNPGRQYVVYQPKGEDAAVKVNLPAGTYTYEWFDPTRGRRADHGETTATGAPTQFSCPLPADGVLFLKRKSR
jgi:hypothetical protein